MELLTTVQSNLNLSYNSLIIGALVIFAPMLFVLIFSLFKFQKFKSSSIFIYSFMSGMMIILATFGFMREAYTTLESTNHATYSTGAIIGIIVGGVVFGLALTIGIRLLIVRFSKETHINHKEHNHTDILINTSDVETKSSFWVIIWSLLAHKIIAGLSLGMLMFNSSSSILGLDNIGLIIITIVHMIPESIMIFHKSIEITKSKWKSFAITAGLQVVIVIFLVAGIFLFNEISTIEWIMPFLFSITGGSILFVAVIDLAPEFIHNKNMSKKQWYLTMSLFALGITFGVAMGLIHHH